MPHPDFSYDSEGESERALREGTAGSVLIRGSKKRNGGRKKKIQARDRSEKVGLVRSFLSFIYRLASTIVAVGFIFRNIFFSLR